MHGRKWKRKTDTERDWVVIANSTLIYISTSTWKRNSSFYLMQKTKIKNLKRHFNWAHLRSSVIDGIYSFIFSRISIVHERMQRSQWCISMLWWIGVIQSYIYNTHLLRIFVFARVSVSAVCCCLSLTLNYVANCNTQLWEY